MSLKSISLAAILAGAMFFVGCGDGGPTNSPPLALSIPPVIIDTAVDPIPFDIQLSGTDTDALTYVFDSISTQSVTTNIVGDPATGLVAYDPPASFSGVDSFTFYVSDGIINSNVVTVYVAVDNVPPVAISQPSVAATEDTAVVPLPDIVLTADDPDTAANPETDGIVFEVDVTGLAGTLDTSAMNDIATLGQVTFNPTLNFNGTTSFTFTVSDHVLWSVASATVTIDVTPVNDAPVAIDDIVIIDFGMPATIYVLANDTDIEGDALSIVPAGFTQGSHGTVTHDVSNDTFIYVPDTMYFGPDTFTYQITDGALTSNIATVSITVSNPRCSVYGWGENNMGELGIGTQGSTELIPTRTKNDIIKYGWDIWGGAEFTIFHDSYRNIWTCGNNTQGELADPGAPLRDFPRQPPSLGGSDIEAGLMHGIVATGTAPFSYVKTWGFNDNYQLGDGTTEPRDSPVLVLTKDWVVDPNHVYPLRGATAVGAGRAHSLAVTFQPGATTYLTDDEWRVYSWGANNAGQLGQGNTDELTHAKEIVALRGANLAQNGLVANHGGDHIVDVVAFADHSLALDDIGNVYAWGSNTMGECGLGHYNSPVTTPDYVAGGYKQIAAGEQHSYAVTIGGSLNGWGRCEEGQLAHDCPFVAHAGPGYMAIPGDEVLHVASGFDHGVAAAREAVHLDLTQVGLAAAGPPTGSGDPTFYITVTPANLGGTDWTGGTLTNVTRGEVGFILEHILLDVDTVRIVDAGVTAFDPTLWANGDDLDFDTEDWHVYAWGINGSQQCAQTFSPVMFAALVDGPDWEKNAQRRPIRVGAGPYNSFAVIQQVTIQAP